MNHNAILKTHPTVTSVNGDGENAIAWDKDGNIVELNLSLIQEEEARQTAEYESKQYQKKRVAEYPSIGDQLDALFKAGVFPSDMAAQIQAIKDKYPKA
jgi:hypothetical protein